MSVVLSLKRVAEELDLVHDEVTVYLYTRTGEFVTLGMEDMLAAESEEDPGNYPEWQRESILKAGEVLESDAFIPLPSQFDIHQWDIMRRFCLSVDKEDLREDLLDAIHGTGAFRRFNLLIERYDLEQAWHRFRLGVLEEIAVEWLEENGLSYHQDVAATGE